MYTCPEKDIHSVYIDNELPEAYIAEYEAHVKNCPKCAAELALLRNLNSVFIIITIHHHKTRQNKENRYAPTTD